MERREGRACPPQSVLSIAFLCAALLIGCTSELPGPNGDAPDGFAENPVTELPGEGPSLGYLFVARSPDLAGTLNWLVIPDQSALLPERFTLTVTKSAGYEYAEYGLIIGATSEGSFLLFVIDTQGSYRIANKPAGAGASAIGDWTPSAALRIGYDLANELEVGFGDAVSFRLNGTEVYTVTDPGLAEGGRGIIAYVGSEEYEDFDAGGVEVTYRITSVE